jgi:hypothetical protein
MTSVRTLIAASAIAIIAASITVGLSVSKTAANPLSRTKWEYCSMNLVNGQSANGSQLTGSATINYALSSGNRSETIFSSVDTPNAIDKLEADVVAKAMAKLGDDGWEMVAQGYALRDTGETKTVYFKRATN